MKKERKHFPEVILILILFVLAAAGNALSRADTRERVTGEIYAAEREAGEFSLAELRRIILGEAE